MDETIALFNASERRQQSLKLQPVEGSLLLKRRKSRVDTAPLPSTAAAALLAMQGLSAPSEPAFQSPK